MTKSPAKNAVKCGGIRSKERNVPTVFLPLELRSGLRYRCLGKHKCDWSDAWFLCRAVWELECEGKTVDLAKFGREHTLSALRLKRWMLVFRKHLTCQEFKRHFVDKL